MKKVEKILVATCIILLLQVSASTLAGAKDEYPEKPIRFIVGLVAGSLTDISARAIAKVSSKYLEKPIVVINLPGGAQTIAYNELVNSPADGHTIALYPTSFRYLGVHMLEKIPFDVNILKPFLAYADFRQMLFVRADSPYANWKELVAYGRGNPGSIKFGHSARGTVMHLQGVCFFRNAGVQATDVPFKGNIEVISGVLGGHITGGICDYSGIKEQVRARQLKAVVVFLERRHEGLPEVPTSQEIGFGDLSVMSPMFSIVIHRDTPVERVRKIHDALRHTIEDPECMTALHEMGLKSRYISAEVVEKHILSAERICVPILKNLNLFKE